MATLYFGKASVGGLWSDTSKWWTDLSRTVAAGAVPTVADDVILDASSGNCTVAAPAVTLSVNNVAHTGTLQVDSTLAFRATTSLNGVASTITFGVSGDIVYDAAIGNASLLMTWRNPLKLFLTNNTVTDRTLSVSSTSIGSISHLGWSITSTGHVTLSAGNAVAIDSYTAGGTAPGGVKLRGTLSSSLWMRTNTDTRDFVAFLNYISFGYDRDVAVLLTADTDRNYGSHWRFENNSSNDITISVETPDVFGNLYLDTQLLCRQNGSGELNIDFSGANLSPGGTSAEYLPQLTCERVASTGLFHIDWGSTSTFGISGELDTRGVTSMSGGGSGINTLYMRGAGQKIIRGPDDSDLDAPTSYRLPFDVDISTEAAGNTNTYFTHGIDLSGDVLIWLNGADDSVILSDQPTFQDRKEFRADFYVYVYDNSDLTIEEPTAVRGTLSINKLFGFATEFDFDIDADLDLYGPVEILDSYININQTTAVVTVHCRSGGGQTITLNGNPQPGSGLVDLGQWDFVQEIDGGAGSTGKLVFDYQGLNFLYGDLTFTNLVDAEMEFQFESLNDKDLYVDAAYALTSRGRGAICSLPYVDDYAVHLFGPSASFLDFHVPNGSVGTWTKYTNIRNTGGGTIDATDRTCFDAGGNSGIDFTDDPDEILGVCNDVIDFDAISGALVPDAQVVLVENVGGGALDTITLASVPSWLDATIGGFGDDQTVTIQPNTTTMPADVTTATFYVLSTGAARSPVPVYVTYTLTHDLYFDVDPDTLEFEFLRAENVPVPVFVSVDNGAAGATDEMDEIEVSGVPAWLDVDINPGSSSSSDTSAAPSEGYNDDQGLLATINATGLALSLGTYTADLLISAANVPDPFVLSVTYVVDEITIIADPTALTFEMKEASGLPPNQAIELGNPGGGVLDPVTVSGDPAWLDYVISGTGETQYIEFSVNSAAQALAIGEHVATLSLDAANAARPTAFIVTLSVIARTFLLTPDELEFTPDTDWTVAGERVSHAVREDYAITELVTIIGTPVWLSVVVDASNLNNQLITVAVNQVAFDALESPDDYAVELLITAKGTGVESTLPLAIAVVTPAFFRRASCTMDFIPKVEGTLVEECDVPPPPPPLPVIPTPVPAGGGSFSLEGSVGTTPCLECTLEVEYGDGDSYSNPTITLECTEHGCYPTSVEGTYCGAGNAVVGSITLDECGHVCEVVCGVA